jgi:microcystin-dependent protein
MSYEPYIGEIMMWAGNYAPEGWAYCDGSTLSIAQNNALFALLGTAYGGDGMSTFKLPDLRGRVPMGIGQGAGLSPRQWGEWGGSESATVTLGSPQQITQADTGPAATVSTAPPSAAVNVGTVPPFQALSFVIALYGVWPSRP